MAVKKHATSLAPSLFDLDLVTQKEEVTVRVAYEDGKTKSSKTKYSIANLGINSDYEKYGEIKLLKNKLP